MNFKNKATMLFLGLSLAGASRAQTQSVYEINLHKLITAWFAAPVLGTDEDHLETVLQDMPDDAKAALSQLQTTTAKLGDDAKAGLSAFDSELKVNLAVARATSDAAMARSALSRLRTDLANSGSATSRASDLEKLATELDELVKTLGT